MGSRFRLITLLSLALSSLRVLCETYDKSHDDVCAISPKAIVHDACASYSTLERLNTIVGPVLDDVVSTTDFFSYYRLNLFHKKCPFWDDANGMCGNIACAVETLDNEEDIPQVWRASELGKLEGPLAKHPGKSAQRERSERPLQGKLGEDVGESCVVEYDDECDERDYCVLEDESAASKGDYVSLLRNPERFTGYAGDGAKQVWDAIYRENCFQKSSFPYSTSFGKTTTRQGSAAMDFKAVMEAAGRQQVLEQRRQENPLTPFVAQSGLELEDECLEKRVFYRVISGMHASISTHLCWEFLNQMTGQWQPNVQCYVSRLHEHPERISNLYFNFALVTRAISKLGPYLSRQSYTFCNSDADQDVATRAKVTAVTEKASSVPQIFDESLMFKDGEGPSLKEDFRNRFRNVSRLMDCVGCDKCRLWGKLQTSGYGTALKVLFEFDNNESPEVPVLKRTELVALFNTYARLSHSLTSVQKFRVMVEGTPDEKAEEPDATPGMKKSDDVVNASESRAEDSSTEDTETGFSEADFSEPAEKDDPPPPHQNNTIQDEFREELRKINWAVRFVLRKWAELPKTMWQIATSELYRFWRFYIGLPVPERTWTFGHPVTDEL